MNIVILGEAANIALIESDDFVIIDVQSAIDLMATIRYDTGCNRMIVEKSAIIDDFFILSTCLAGNILQKYINYRMKIAIIGDFSEYSSKPLKDFIYESNRGKDIFFLTSVNDAVEKLSTV
jgi:hypothetical protein